MKHFPAGQDTGERGAGRRRHAVVAGDRQSAKGENAQSDDDAGDAEFLVMFGLARFEPGKDISAKPRNPAM